MVSISQSRGFLFQVFADRCHVEVKTSVSISQSRCFLFQATNASGDGAFSKPCFHLAIEMLLISRYKLQHTPLSKLQVSISQSRGFLFQVMSLTSPSSRQSSFPSRNREASYFKLWTSRRIVKKDGKFQSRNREASYFKPPASFWTLGSIFVSISQSRCFLFQAYTQVFNQFRGNIVSISQSRCFLFQEWKLRMKSGYTSCFNLAIEMLLISS